MNSVTVLMTSHNIVNPNSTPLVQHPNHELCHRTEEVAQHCESRYHSWHAKPCPEKQESTAPGTPSAMSTRESKCSAAKLVSPVIIISSRIMTNGRTVHSPMTVPLFGPSLPVPATLSTSCNAHRCNAKLDEVAYPSRAAVLSSALQGCAAGFMVGDRVHD
jgi:hypothetical protein